MGERSMENARGGGGRNREGSDGPRRPAPSASSGRPGHALAEELTRHATFVRGIAASLLGGDEAAAEDVAQDAALLAIERPPRRNDGLRTWLATTARRLALRRRRSEERRSARERQVASAADDRDVDDAARAEILAAVTEAVLALPRVQRSTVLRRFHGGRSAREIAAEDGVSLHTVHSRLRRAMAEIRARLGRSIGENGWIGALALVAGRPAAPPTASGAPATSSSAPRRAGAALRRATEVTTIMTAKQTALGLAAALALLAIPCALVLQGDPEHDDSNSDAHAPDVDAAPREGGALDAGGLMVAGPAVRRTASAPAAVSDAEPRAVPLRARSDVASRGDQANLGRLPDDLLQEAIDLLRMIIGNADRQLRESLESPEPDWVEAARVRAAIATAKAEIQMLENGEYVLLAPGVVDEIWPGSPEGFKIMRLDTVQLPDERMAEIVIPVEIARFPLLEEAVEGVAIAESNSGRDAAYRFNGLGDAERAAAVAACDDRDSKPTAAVVWIRQARRVGFRLDRRTNLLIE